LGIDRTAGSSNDTLLDPKANESDAGDLGVRISRPIDRPTETPVAVQHRKTSKLPHAAPVPRQESSISKPKKSKSKAKKAKSANAIDDIFNFID
jgi:hypothetical protein